MKAILKPLTLLLLLLTTNAQDDSTNEISFVQKRNDMCGTDPRPLIELTENQFKELRSHRDNVFSNAYKSIVTYYNEDDSGALFDTFLPYAVLLILWMVVIIASLVVFILLCLGKYKKPDVNDKLYTTFACVFFWIFIVLFVVAFVFIGLSMATFFKTACSAYDIPSTLVEGVNTQDDKFLGLEKFVAVFDDFHKEIDNSNDVQSNIQKIFDADTPTGTNQAWTQLIDFVAKHKDTRIQDGAGDAGVPNSIVTFTPGISNILETHFVKTDLTAERIQIAAEQGLAYQQAATRAKVKEAVNNAKAKTEEVIVKMQKLFDPYSNSAEKAYDFASVGYIILLVIGILAIIFFAIVLVTLCSWCARDQCEGCLKPSKIFLVVVGFLILIFSILTFIIMVGSVSISSFCGITARVNENDYTVFDELGDGIDPQIKKYFQICSTSQGSGDLRDLFDQNASGLLGQTTDNSDNTDNTDTTDGNADENSQNEASDVSKLKVNKNDYDSFVNFLDGLSAYEVYYNEEVSSAVSAQTTGDGDNTNNDNDTNNDNNGNNTQNNDDLISTQTAIWTDYQNGTLLDFPTVQPTLDSLNSLVACAGVTYRIGAKQCEGENGCEAITSSSEFSAPSCVEDTNTANDLYANLKAYITDEETLMKNMIEDLTADDRPSAKNLFNESKEAIVNLKNDYDTVKNAFPDTTGNIGVFATNFREVIDCRVLRKAFLRFEQETCFKFNYYVYVVLVLGTVCCLFMLAAAWCACCALRSDSEEHEPSIEAESEKGEKEKLNDEGIDDFEEDELIPNF